MQVLQSQFEIQIISNSRFTIIQISIMIVIMLWCTRLQVFCCRTQHVPYSKNSSVEFFAFTGLSPSYKFLFRNFDSQINKSNHQPQFWQGCLNWSILCNHMIAPIVNDRQSSSHGYRRSTVQTKSAATSSHPSRRWFRLEVPLPGLLQLAEQYIGNA